MNLARVVTIGIIISLFAVLLTFVGCNEPDEFDITELFTLEDFATDWNYAVEYWSMMQRFRKEKGIAVAQMGGTPGAIPFQEVLPQGWSEVDAGNDFEGWFIRSGSSGIDEYLRFDHNIAPPDDIQPVKSEYYSFKEDSVYLGTLERELSMTYADSMSLVYADGGLNTTQLDARALYLNLEVVFSGSGINTTGAGMLSEWRADITGLSTDVDNPAGTYTITGTTTIIALNETPVILPVEIECTMRANSSGEAVIKVKGEERVRVDLTGYDTYYRGVFYMSEDGFTQPIYF